MNRQKQESRMIQVLKRKFLHVYLLSVILYVVFIRESQAIDFTKESCLIRLYERQYFMGQSWTLDSSGNWTSSRKTYFDAPYRNFQTKSIRTYGSNLCKWQICPVRTRRNFHLPRWKRCKVALGGRDLGSLRMWGWPLNIIGYVFRLSNRRARNGMAENRAFRDTANNAFEAKEEFLSENGKS